ncbi:MAG: hypothetical protein JRN24_02035, partial [Nitrososphaerota archaeon]|nr:hypothetical protein [Nitrososphaerota archaeon]
IILRGDLSFLTSAFAQDDEVASIREHEQEISSRLVRATGSSKIALEDLANLGPDVIASAFEGVVPHPKDLAQRLIVEAQYWMRFLGGAVPGMSFVGGPSSG